MISQTPKSTNKLIFDIERSLRLLEMCFIRITVSIGYTLLVSFTMLCWAIIEDYPWMSMALWTTAYFLMLPILRYGFKHFQISLTDILSEKESIRQHFYKRWYRRVHIIVAMHGILVGILTFINRDVPSFEFLILLTVIIAIMLAINAAHMTPILKIYYTYYGLAWGGTLITMPWVFPERWPYLVGLGLVHAGSTALDARRVNKFFNKQVELEQRSTYLAEKASIAEQQATLALRQKNDFIAIASHDLRQPLHALNLNVEALILVSKEVRFHTQLNDIQSCVKTLTLMFNSILDLSKLESGRTGVEVRAFDLRSLLSDLSRVFTAEAKQRNLEFRIRLPKQPVMIECDENLVRQIVTNLLQNSLRYTHKGGILLALRMHKLPRLDVIDTGIGIAEAEQPLIYQAFYRAKVGFSESLQSHGLGLAVVDRCATLLGVKHGFRSSPEKGSQFWVIFNNTKTTMVSSFPVTNDNQKNIENYEKCLVGDRCLIVEDDPIVAKGWQNFLNPTGIELEITTNFNSTLDLLNNGFNPDYVLCDLRLRSGDNGYDVLKYIMKQCPHASYAMVSGEFDAIELEEASEEGIPVLNKPVIAQDLLKMLLLWRNNRSEYS